MTFPDVNVAVLNNGPVDPEPGMWYDGKPRRFPIGKAAIISSAEAYFHFGVEIVGGKIHRDKRDVDDKGLQTQYAAKIATLSPYGLIYGRPEERNKEEFQMLRDWFANGLEFRVAKQTKELDPEAFSRLK